MTVGSQMPELDRRAFLPSPLPPGSRNTPYKLIKFDLNNNINNYLNTVLQNSFRPTILLPTRVTDHTCTPIDHIYYFLEMPKQT